MQERIAIVGLGYVGLPVAVAFAKHYEKTVAFDINIKRVDELKSGIDNTNEIETEELKNTSLIFTSSSEEMRGCSMFIITVPTPVDHNKQPDLGAIVGASKTVGSVLQPGAIVVYESTVYPGVTEDICRKVLAETSGLRAGIDFKVGYSPERINPGDKEHRLETIKKIVSGEDEEALNRVADAYSKFVKAGIHKAPTIKTAEAAKVIENTQRDINIAFMNELSLIFDRMEIRTKDVLEAASTKWNFLRFSPGLVGGHCIGVDPYYLTAKAELLGYHPEVILAGRRINDNMGIYIAQKLVKLLVHSSISVKDAKVAVLGLTFKEDVPDLRNSRVPDIINELKEFGVNPLVHDPEASAETAMEEYGVNLCKWEQIKDLDAIILAVPHKKYMQIDICEFQSKLRDGGIVIDVKSALDVNELKKKYIYWSL